MTNAKEIQGLTKMPLRRPIKSQLLWRSSGLRSFWSSPGDSNMQTSVGANGSHHWFATYLDTGVTQGLLKPPLSRRYPKLITSSCGDEIQAAAFLQVIPGYNGLRSTALDSVQKAFMSIPQPSTKYERSAKGVQRQVKIHLPYFSYIYHGSLDASCGTYFP